MLFKYIADVIRFFSDPSKIQEVYKIILRQSEDEVILKAMIDQIFLDKEEFSKKVKIEREAIKERVVQVQNDNNNNNANNNNHDLLIAPVILFLSEFSIKESFLTFLPTNAASHGNI